MASLPAGGDRPLPARVRGRRGGNPGGSPGRSALRRPRTPLLRAPGRSRCRHQQHPPGRGGLSPRRGPAPFAAGGPRGGGRADGRGAGARAFDRADRLRPVDPRPAAARSGRRRRRLSAPGGRRHPPADPRAVLGALCRRPPERPVVLLADPGPHRVEAGGAAPGRGSAPARRVEPDFPSGTFDELLAIATCITSSPGTVTRWRDSDEPTFIERGGRPAVEARPSKGLPEASLDPPSDAVELCRGHVTGAPLPDGRPGPHAGPRAVEEGASRAGFAVWSRDDRRSRERGARR